MVRNLLAAPIALLTLVSLTACGGSDKGSAPAVRWLPVQGNSVQVAPADDSTRVHQTNVYIDSGAQGLRDVRLRLRDTHSTPAGLDVGGTITKSPTVFEGRDEIWSIGDLQPGVRYEFPIGVWFDVDPRLQRSQGGELTLQLQSPDLSTPLESTALVIKMITE
jgi:hypothetical protein